VADYYDVAETAGQLQAPPAEAAPKSTQGHSYESHDDHEEQ
jgi:hypothetical protein